MVFQSRLSTIIYPSVRPRARGGVDWMGGEGALALSESYPSRSQIDNCFLFSNNLAMRNYYTIPALRSDGLLYICTDGHIYKKSKDRGNRIHLYCYFGEELSPRLPWEVLQLREGHEEICKGMCGCSFCNYSRTCNLVFLKSNDSIIILQFRHRCHPQWAPRPQARA